MPGECVRKFWLNSLWLMYNFAWAAMMKYHGLGGLNNRNLLSQGSVGWKSEIKVSAGLVPSGDCEGESIPCLSPRFLWIVGSLWCPVVCRSIPDLCLQLQMAFSLCMCLCPNGRFIRTLDILDKGSS